MVGGAGAGAAVVGGATVVEGGATVVGGAAVVGGVAVVAGATGEAKGDRGVAEGRLVEATGSDGATAAETTRMGWAAPRAAEWVAADAKATVAPTDISVATTAVTPRWRPLDARPRAVLSSSIPQYMLEWSVQKWRT